VFQLKELLEKDETAAAQGTHNEQSSRITVADVEAAAKHAGLNENLTAAICTFWREQTTVNHDSSTQQQQQQQQQFLSKVEQSAAVAATYLKLQHDWREPALFVNARRLPAADTTAAATNTTAGDSSDTAKYALTPSLHTADHIALLISMQQRLGQQVVDWMHSELATTETTTTSTTDSDTTASTSDSSDSGNVDAVSDAVLQLVTFLQAHYAEKSTPIAQQIQQLSDAYSDFKRNFGQSQGQSDAATATAAQLTSGQCSL
jgi:hypothetical protein